MHPCKRKAAIGAALAGFAMTHLPQAVAEPVPGGTLDPLTIPKYVEPLVIPPVLYDDGGVATNIPYEVSLRQINQQVLPTGFPTTPLWAYGNPADPTTFNNPGFTIEVTKDNETTVKWMNELIADPANCNQARSRRRATGTKPECDFLPHIIQDRNGTPIVDQTLHWAAPNKDCLDGIPRTDCRGASDQPYLGPVPMVTHVHGAHVGPGSDGYPEAWWLPKANNIPAGYAFTGTFFESDNGSDTTNAQNKGYAIDRYPNDQPTATLWYHDHSLGMTRLNVYAAGAGFWMIRDAQDGETGLRARDALGAPQRLPGPAPLAGDSAVALNTPGDPTRIAVREIPLAIQPKSFNRDGSQFYPADRAFFEGLGNGRNFARNPGIRVPFLPQATSDISPVWNPEAFFNTMVVNGKTWPVMEVAPERYRFRFVNASDSRFLNLSLRKVRPDGTLGAEIPFYQIGAEQSLLPKVVRVVRGEQVPLPGDGTVPPVNRVRGDPTALLIGPAERPDVIVDFSQFLNGRNIPDGTIIRMINTAPDAPFGGFPDVPADPDTTGQVMQFVVNSALANPIGDISTESRYLRLTNAPGGAAKLGAPSARRDLALLEEESALLCVTFNATSGAIDLDPNSVPPMCDPVLGSFPFAPKAAVLGVNGRGGGTVQLWDDPISTNPAVGDIETWELWNWSADAHPIHLHLVKFQVLDRAPVGDRLARRAAEPGERGWKDTVIAYPGEVTRVKAEFDVAGLYVWHCHILSHEDNEMMVPFCVGEIGVDCPAELF